MFDTEPRLVAVGSERSILFKTGDGAELVGRLYKPRETPKAAVVLNGATGVPQTYYRHFARWLAAERGIACLTYDYRDVGRSVSGPLHKSKADMADWGIADAEAARRCLRREATDVPIWVIGHSLGAMLVHKQGERDGVERVIGVASGEVHYRDHPWPYQALVWLFWFGLGPLATILVGYLPGRTIGFGAELPKGVYWQWRRWCTSRSFIDGDTSAKLPPSDWGAGSPPVRLVGFSDDIVIPFKCTQRLERRYGKCELVEIDPLDYGLRSVGHLGAFAEGNRAVWDTIVA